VSVLTQTATQAETVTRLLQRQILPIDGDIEVFPLYVDTEPAILDADKYEVGSSKSAREFNAFSMRQSISSGRTLHPDQIESRTSLRIDAEDTVSFGTYFNAFPASYWRRYTVVTAVTLTVRVEGRGARVVVYKSQASGKTQQVDSADTGDQDSSVFTFELTLKPFVDGGWYWYDVIAADHDVRVVSAEWTADVPADRAQHGTVDLAITTMNRPDFCAKLLGQLGEDEVLRPYLDTVFVMEQGTQKVVDSEFYPDAEKALDGTLQVIEQGNLGGSGGYARGQLESLRKGTATYMMCMDDDVICEPEGVIRAITFGDLARRPTLVGGHMFNIYARARMHSFGEIVQPWRFWWQSAPGVFGDWDFSARNLRSTRWLHKRVDVDFNGWFMCLIPRVVLEEIGLSLPLFLKWDDSEYGLRAKEAGYPTVSFPGAAVWHVPWSDKNDGLDWQSYFHHRNRFVAALLHSIYPKGGRMITESFNHQIKHLVSMQYSTVEIRHQALLDVLAGPEKLHQDLPTKLAEVKKLASQFQDAKLEVDREAFPEVRRHKPPRKGRDDTAVPYGWEVKLAALKAPLRQLRKPRQMSRRFPEAELPAMDSQWYRITKYDSVVVSMNDGQTAAFYQRDPERFRDLLKKTVDIHARLRREWPRLAEEYRSKLAEVTSPEAWDETFRPWTGSDGAAHE
jgi:galactofuranosylgalactofuranosylrhamnosyl-N-acetylglucosaminyl-diphospho-decaprenol beta-1,5/1,6-galactofuranosyltransferase